MLFREIIVVCSEIHIKHINTLCGQKVTFVNVKPRGTYRSHWVSMAKKNHKCISYIIFWAEKRA